MPIDLQAANKAIIERFQSAMHTNDPEVISRTIDQYVEPNVDFHAPVPAGASGAEALKRVMAMLHRAFPDLHVQIEDMVAEGDKVVARNTVTGTQTGEYMGFPPSGKQVTYKEIFICRLVEGRITEIWGVVDSLTQLKQIGAIPA